MVRLLAIAVIAKYFGAVGAKYFIAVVDQVFSHDKRVDSVTG